MVDGVTYSVWCRDVVKVSSELFANPFFVNHTALHFELKLDNQGRRVRDEFHTGDWFQKAQVSVPFGLLFSSFFSFSFFFFLATRSFFLSSLPFKILAGPYMVPIAIMVHLDEKRVAIKDSRKAYPVALQLGNHDFATRKLRVSKRLGAYFPLVEGRWKNDRKHVLKVHQEALKIFLRPIREAFGRWLVYLSIFFFSSFFFSSPFGGL